MRKKIALVSIPGKEVLSFHDVEKKFWMNYLGLLKTEGVYSISSSKTGYVGNSIHQHVGLLHLGNILKKRGHEVTYIAPSKDVTLGDLEKQVLECAKDQDYVGYSFHTCGEPDAEKIAQKVAQVNNRIKQLAGGPHISGFDSKPAGKHIDIYVKGRAHIALPWIIEHNFQGEIFDSSNIRVQDLTGFIPYPFPLPDNSLMQKIPLPGARVYTSLGCGRANPCIFCGSIVDHRKYIEGQLDSIFENIKSLVDDHGTEFLYIGDEDFFRNPKHAAEVVKRLATEYAGQLRYSVQASVETLMKNRSLLDLIAQYGMCNEIQVGVESADQKILDISNKRLQIKDVSEIGKIVQSKGIKFFGYWLSWLPGETIDTHNYTTDEICKLLDNGGMDYAENCIVVPFPGTELARDKDKFGIKIVENNYSHWRGENLPVFEFVNGPSRDVMYQSYLDRIKRMGNIYGLRIPSDQLANIGVDPARDMSGF